MTAFGNGGFKLPGGVKLPSMVSGSYTLNPPTNLTPYSKPSFSVPQRSVPGATATGSQIDRPGGAGGYAMPATHAAVSTQLGIDDTAATMNDYYKQYQDMMANDSLYNQQKNTLNTGVQDYYQSSVLSPAQQAMIAYGGALPDTNASGGKIDYSQYAAPKDLSGNSFSQSLASALGDQKYADDATHNPYSDLAQITRQYDLANSEADANAVGRGLGFSGEITQHHNENQQAADFARYGAQGNFLNTLSGLYNNYLGQYSAAGDKLSGFANDTSNRVIALINAGILAAKPFTQTTANAAKTAAPSQTRGPSNSSEETPQGKWDYGIFGDSDLTGDESATDLQSTVSTPNYAGVFPSTSAAPVAVRIAANKSGGSANKKQGVFSIH